MKNTERKNKIKLRNITKYKIGLIDKGITLVSLVITIIIIIILATVTINMAFGDNGLIHQAELTKEMSANSTMSEEIRMNRLMQEYANVMEEDSEISVPEIKATEANAPKLSNGMIPVKYNTETGNWVICAENDEEWYSYTENEKKWANIMLSDGKYYASNVGANFNTSGKEEATVGTEVTEADLGSMFVWIPRYAYQITSGYHESSGSIDVVWVEGTSYNYVNENGESHTAQNGNTNGVITTNGYTDYVVHPAFTNGSSNEYSNGEWKQEIEGIWVAKFDAGIITTANDTTAKVADSSTANGLYYPVFKGRKFGYNYVTVSQCYDLSLALDDNDNPYGLSSSSNSHLMKNSEFGAVAYLSISEYGYAGGNATEETEKAKNNLSVVAYSSHSSSPIKHPNDDSFEITAITGYSAPIGIMGENVMSYVNTNSLTDEVMGSNGTSYAWNNTNSNDVTGNGTLASTTGNIYGIYDIGGGLMEYTASYVNAEGVENLITNGGSFANGTSTYLATAYPYNPTETDNKDMSSAYSGFSEIFGDAIYETSSNIGTRLAWFGESVEEDINRNEVFFIRAASYHSTNLAGICSVADNNGTNGQNSGFHSVLIVE